MADVPQASRSAPFAPPPSSSSSTRENRWATVCGSCSSDHEGRVAAIHQSPASRQSARQTHFPRPTISRDRAHGRWRLRWHRGPRPSAAELQQVDADRQSFAFDGREFGCIRDAIERHSSKVHGRQRDVQTEERPCDVPRNPRLEVLAWWQPRHPESCVRILPR